MNYGIGNIKGKSKSLFTTTTAPTESGDVITLATTDIVESGFKVGDYLAYVDNGNISALYSISAISSGTATLSLVGAFGGGGGGGKQLYQHYYYIVDQNSQYIFFNIITDNPTPLDKNGIGNYLYNKGFNANYKYYPAFGYADNSNIMGITYNNYFDAYTFNRTAIRLYGTSITCYSTVAL